MGKKPRPAELLSSLLKQNRYSGPELDHLFRLLSKRSHPDTAGGSGDEFIQLRRIYESARSRMGGNIPDMASVPRSQFRRTGSSFISPEVHTAERSSTFDPDRIIREAGYDETLSSRGCLFLSLRVFFNLGMYNYRIRSISGLQRRNAAVLDTILYWARIYNPGFADIFSAYCSLTVQSLSTTWEIKNFNYARRLFLDGVTGFFNYQVSGRTGTAEVAREKFTWCVYTLDKVIKDTHPMGPLAEWFTEELDAPPELKPQ